jgi:hypothetical protein
MTIMKGNYLILLCLLLSACGSDRTTESCTSRDSYPGKIAIPGLPFNPEQYMCYRASSVINIDGEISESEWANAPWSRLFTDIEGDLKPAPLYDTRVKMLWDDDNLYVAAELKEPHIRATLKQRDTVIFHDNDFEVFIDPDGDTHGYYEFEMNAFNTVWDLLLTAPYRDSGHVIDAWDITGLRSAVKIYGTLNDPSDTDDKWTIEIAFPFEVLSEWGNVPVDGTQWRMNFSRVNWRTKVTDGLYSKLTDSVTGRTLPEFNWLWSPQGLVNVHYPEMWGFVQFAGSEASSGDETLVINPDEYIKWELRKLYYAQRACADGRRGYADRVSLLAKYGYEPGGNAPEILLTMEGYEACLPNTDNSGFVCINSSGRTWIKKSGEPDR